VLVGDLPVLHPDDDDDGDRDRAPGGGHAGEHPLDLLGVGEGDHELVDELPVPEGP
jgi:hypothetical protein